MTDNIYRSVSIGLFIAYIILSFVLIYIYSSKLTNTNIILMSIWALLAAILLIEIIDNINSEVKI